MENEIPTLEEFTENILSIENQEEREEAIARVLGLVKEGGEIEEYLRLKSLSLIVHKRHLTKGIYKNLFLRLTELNNEIDEYGETVDSLTLVGYDYLLGSLPDIIDLQVPTILHLIDHFQNAITTHGLTPKRAHEIRRDVLIKLGRIEEAIQEQEKAAAYDFEDYGPHPCEGNSKYIEAKFHQYLGNYKLANAAAKRTFKYDCDAHDDLVTEVMLVPWLKKGKIKRAVKRFVNMEEQNTIRVMNFLTLTRNYEWALECMEENFELYHGQMLIREQLTFYQSVLLLLTEMEKNGEKTINFQFPSDFPIKQNEDYEYPIDELKAWFEVEIMNRIEQLNQRNGNDYYSTAFEEHQKLSEFATPEKVELIA